MHETLRQRHIGPQANPPVKHAVEARRLLRTCRSGALATLSQRLDGHPFASVVPFMSDFDGSPILLVSRLAEHTKNIAFDARVSLMVHEPGADVQASARLTIAGRCTRFAADDLMRQRYIRHFPQAADLLALDFEFHRIEPTAIRYIGGFGRIHWIACETFVNAAGITCALERDLIDAIATRSTVSQLHVIAVDCDGIDHMTSNGVTRIAFDESVGHAEELTATIERLSQS